MNFTIDNSAPSKQSRCASKLLQVIRQLPDGALITCRGLADKAGYAEAYLSSQCVFIPEEFSVKHGNKKLYGNAKTIAAWKKQRLPH